MNFKEIRDVFADIDQILVASEIDGVLSLTKDSIKIIDRHGEVLSAKNAYPKLNPIHRDELNYRIKNLSFYFHQFESEEMLISNLCLILLEEFKDNMHGLLDIDHPNLIDENISWAENILNKYIIRII